MKVFFFLNKYVQVQQMIRNHFNIHKLELNYYLTCEICKNVKLSSIKQIKKHEANFHDEHFNGC